MTEIERKALALVNEVEAALGLAERTTQLGDGLMAMCLRRAIEQHEAFRTEVSDAVEEAMEPYCSQQVYDALKRFRIAKPDPLVEAVGDAMQAHEVYSKYELTDSLRAALAARGLKIVEDKP